MPNKLRWNDLNQAIVDCTRCPRLVKHCRDVAKVKRKAYLDFDYWGKPVPNFGPRTADVMIVGLAPGAHGANRTGRMFTGDRSGDWLFRALHRTGFANQPDSSTTDDGLRLKNCLVTAACHCAPPDNKPTRDELAVCSDWFRWTMELTRPKVMVVLGGIAWNSVFRFAKGQGWHEGARPKFGHGMEHTLANRCIVIGSYHPSQQNTFTGRLTESMLESVFVRAHTLLSQQKDKTK